MPEKKRGLIVESPPLAKVIAQALQGLAEWYSFTDNHQLPRDLGAEMLERRIDVAIIHANKPNDEPAVLSILAVGLPVLVMTRNPSSGAVEHLKPMYDKFAAEGIPLLRKPVFVIELQELVHALLEGTYNADKDE